MRFGWLKHRVTIQIPTRSQNSFKEWVESWSTWKTVWASIEPTSGKRYFEAKQANADIDGIIRIRYLTGLQPFMRIKYGSRIFQIKSIITPREYRSEIHIYYKEALD